MTGNKENTTHQGLFTSFGCLYCQSSTICSLWVGAINMSTYLRLTIWSLLFDIHNSQLVLDDRSLSHLSIQTLLSFFQISVSYQVHIFPYHFFDRLQSIDSNHCLFYMVCLQIRSKWERFKIKMITGGSKSIEKR